MERSQENVYQLNMDPVTVEMTEGGRKTFWIVLIIIAFIAIALIIGWAVYLSNKNASYSGTSTAPKKFSRPNYLLEENIGAVGGTSNVFYNAFSCQAYRDAVTCETSDRRFWNNNAGQTGKCECVAPFWGPLGQRESFSNDYTMIGHIDPSIANYTIISSHQVDRLSFPQANLSQEQALCTPLCDNDVNCTGVIWHKDSGLCDLLARDVNVIPGKNLSFSLQEDSNLLLKDPNRPHFSDRVFLYESNLGRKYWLRRRILGQRAQMITVNQGEIEIFLVSRFRPTKFINEGNLVGVYANKEFTLAEALNIIQNPNDFPDFYIHYPGQPLNIPAHWLLVWVTYIANN